MRYRHSLRFRIIFSYLVFGLAIGGVLAAFLFMLINEIEDHLITDHVTDEMEYFIRLTNEQPGTKRLHTKKLNGYKVKQGEQIQGFEFLSKLPTGNHNVEHQDREYAIAVNERGGVRYYMLYDTTDFKVREHFIIYVLFSSILLTTVIAVWFGYWLSGKLIAPVIQLARQVESLPAYRANISLSSEYAGDEVGKLAKAFDDYKDRLERFIQRERSFTADASHELRTPLAVIQGAVEVMLSREDIDEQQQRRLERIERAAGDMAENLAALLILAREPGAETALEGETDIAHTIDEMLRKQQTFLGDKQIEVLTDYRSHPRVAAPRAIVAILVGNLIRNAFCYTHEGQVRIQLDKDSLVVEDTGIGIDADDLDHVFNRGYRGKAAPGKGSGLGLSIAKRIIDHYSWDLDIKSDKTVGTRVTWTFLSASSANNQETAEIKD